MFFVRRGSLDRYWDVMIHDPPLVLGRWKPESRREFSSTAYCRKWWVIPDRPFHASRARLEMILTTWALSPMPRWFEWSPIDRRTDDDLNDARRCLTLWMDGLTTPWAMSDDVRLFEWTDWRLLERCPTMSSRFELFCRLEFRVVLSFMSAWALCRLELYVGLSFMSSWALCRLELYVVS